MQFFKFLVPLLIVLLSACSERDTESVSPDVIRVGVLPDQEAAILQKRYSPLLSFLQKQTGLRYDLVIPESYGDLLDQFNSGQLEMAYFGAVTFLKAREVAGAEPLVTRDVDNRFTSVIIIPSNSEAKSLQDLKGKRFSFGSKLSTSGHIMPRYFLLESDIEADQFFQDVKYSGGHDKTAYAVQKGIVDAGTLNAVVYNSMISDGRLDKSRVKVLWESPPYQDYAWAIQAQISNTIKNSIRDGFLGLSQAVSAQKHVLDAIGANYFLPLRNQDFDKLQRAMDKVYGS